MRRCLQALSWQKPDDSPRWLLKSPVHLEQLDALLDVFPDAKIVQTHRDPNKTVASFCSMVAHGRGLFSDVVEPLEIGAHWLRKVQRMVHRAMDVRASRPPESFMDVGYWELMADPVAVATAVCRFGGDSVEEPQCRRLHAWLSSNHQHRHGRHAYSAGDFGIGGSRIDEAMADYVAHHAVAVEC